MTIQELAAKGIAPPDWPPGLRRWWSVLFGKREKALRLRLNAMRSVHGADLNHIEEGEGFLSRNNDAKRAFGDTGLTVADRDGVQAFAREHPAYDTVGEMEALTISFAPIDVG